MDSSDETFLGPESHEQETVGEALTNCLDLIQKNILRQVSDADIEANLCRLMHPGAEDASDGRAGGSEIPAELDGQANPATATAQNTMAHAVNTALVRAVLVTNVATQRARKIVFDAERKAEDILGTARAQADEIRSRASLPPGAMPFLRINDTGDVIPLRKEVTTIGRSQDVDVRLDDPSVSRLHAEIVRRGPNIYYVADLGLSRGGTRVNGRPVARRVLDEGDLLSFGSALCQISGLQSEDIAAESGLRRFAAPELTRRELNVLISLCRPVLSDDPFIIPPTAREIADDLVVTEAAVKHHLLRLYQKFRIPEGPNRRTRLANEVITLGLAQPLAEHSSRQDRPLGIGH